MKDNNILIDSLRQYLEKLLKLSSEAWDAGFESDGLFFEREAEKVRAVLSTAEALFVEGDI